MIKKKIKTPYEIALGDARHEFDQNPIIREMFKWNVQGKFLELFVIHWSVLSAGLTHPIPKYLHDAGEGCKKMGLDKMAEFFYEHAKEEEAHDKWAEADAEKLVSSWNKKNKNLMLDPKELLEKRFSPAVKRYHAFHEDVIYGQAPYAELAIDVEIERITVVYGPRMMLQCLFKMGPRVFTDMSFLRDHVRFDFGHTDHNMEVLEELLNEHPEFLPKLIEGGKGGLKTYADFLGDCMAYTQEKFNSAS